MVACGNVWGLGVLRVILALIGSNFNKVFCTLTEYTEVVRYDFGYFGEASILRKAFPGNIYLDLPGGGGCD